MKERPITLNNDMVRAVFDGRKTQTRRIIQERHLYCGGRTTGNWPVHMPEGVEGEKARLWAANNSPFGAVGDRLWVRETWMPDAPRDGTWADVEFYGCKGSPLSMIPKRFRKPEHCIYRASWDGSVMVGWTPSIHMPRWASRITLEITGVRVERLNSMTERDAIAEGCIGGHNSIPGYHYSATPHEHFHHVWQSIYGGDSWQANPWVWVIEFKRVEGE